jgi:sodium transport system permease protein
MNLSRIFVVARKELTDGFRDRRAIITVLVSAMFGPFLIAFMFNQIAGQNKAAQEIKLPVVGREYGPILVNWLEQQPGVEIVAGPSDPEAAVRDGKEDVVLVIKSDFAKNFRDSRPAPVQVLSDSTRQAGQPKVKRLTSLLETFNGQTGSLRLVARGISPSVANALKVEELNIANSQQRAATALNVLLVFLMMAILTSGMQIATDSTAGERERSSLEPLLLNPVPRWQFAAGKWLAAATAAMIGLLAVLLITSRVLSRLPLESLGIRFHLGTPEILLLIAAAGPMVFLAPAMQVCLSCFAKSYKEAQSYSAFLVLAAAIPGMISVLYPTSSHPWMRPLPIFGQYALGNDILSGKIPSPLILIAAALEALILSGILLAVTARLFTSEKIIFGRS